MTRDEIAEATAEAAAAAEQLVAHLGRLTARMQDLFPLSADVLMRWDDDHRERLYALLRMFDQLYDLTTRKLLRGLLALSGETIAGLSAQNQFRRAEAIGGLPDADRWMELGATRNLLAHDYPTNPSAQAERDNRAWADLPALLEGTSHVLRYLHAEGLLP